LLLVGALAIQCGVLFLVAAAVLAMDADPIQLVWLAVVVFVVGLAVMQLARLSMTRPHFARTRHRLTRQSHPSKESKP
jgi:hypothetical protein